jgi:CBS domain-containing protein
VVIIETSDTVAAAVERMQAHEVGTLLILNELRQPIGILSDRDLAIRVLGAALDPRTTTVAGVMTAWPATIQQDAPIDVAVAEMKARGCRRLPVVTDEDKLVGILSLDDIIANVADELGQIRQVWNCHPNGTGGNKSND